MKMCFSFENTVLSFVGSLKFKFNQSSFGVQSQSVKTLPDTFKQESSNFNKTCTLL